MAKIMFGGICCLADPTNTPSAPVPRKGIMPNASRGKNDPNAAQIPGHSAFIDAAIGDVDASDWPDEWLRIRKERTLFKLEGDFVEFLDDAGQPVLTDPSSIDISALEKAQTKAGGCGDQIDESLLEHPSADDVAALIDLPGGPIEVQRFARGALVSVLTVPNGTRIVATTFDGNSTRSLKIVNANATITIANVVLNDYITGEGPVDEAHGLLYCDILIPPESTPALGDLKALKLTSKSASRQAPNAATKGCGCGSTANATITRFMRKDDPDPGDVSSPGDGNDDGSRGSAAHPPFGSSQALAPLDTLAGGCSNTQWP